MNSLSFLSKQFDVLASTSVPQTPASTPTDERFSHLGDGGMSHPQLKRSQTWSARSFFIPPPSQPPSYHQRKTTPPTRSRKRSGSTPFSVRYPFAHSTISFPSSSTFASTSASASGSIPGASDEPSEVKDLRAPASQPPAMALPEPPVIQPKLTPAEFSWFHRMYIIRLLYIFVNWLWTSFSVVARAILRHGLSATGRDGKKTESDDEGSGDEKESDDDFNTTIRLSIGPMKRPNSLRARTSSLASIVLPPSTKPPTPQPAVKPPTPSPLSKSYSPPPPILTVTPYAEEATSDRTDLLAPALPIISSDNNFLQPGFRASATAPALSSSGAFDNSSPKSQKKSALHPSRRKTLVLDLDETLIHSTTRPLYPSSMGSGSILDFGSLIGFGGRTKKAGHMVEVVMGGRSTLYHVYKRPFVDYFLRKVSTWYTLVIFTASMKEYADPVIDWLDAGRGILALRRFREHCTQLDNGSYAKDLSKLEIDLSRVCLLDNSPVSYSINPANGIPIEGWTQDPNDEALLDLLPVLDSLRFTSDVRHVLGLRGF